MRSDMSKVVTERPRYGHANRSKKTGLRVRCWNRNDYYNGKDDLDGPKRIKSSRQGQYGWYAKDFSDRLGPLKRFLQSRVGKNWNRVYGELSQILSKRSITGQHIWEHVRTEVELHCVIDETGKICRKEAHFGSRREITKGLYVHPKTKILCEVERKKK